MDGLDLSINRKPSEIWFFSEGVYFFVINTLGLGYSVANFNASPFTVSSIVPFE